MSTIHLPRLTSMATAHTWRVRPGSGGLLGGLIRYPLCACFMPRPPTGTVMSNTYGLAKKATAIAVRVLDENGSGYME